MRSPEDVEITLSHGSQRAIVAPLGASLRRYFVVHGETEVDIAWGYSGRENKQGGQGDVLIPFPSRIRDGRYTFQGQTYQLERNDKQGPNAIHGFLREATWEHKRAGDAAVRFHYDLRAEGYALRGYPFSLDVAVAYALGDDGLSCEFEIRNSGEGPAPVGVGYHPYFVAGTETVDDAEARLPATHYLEFEKTLVPTGNLIPVAGTPLDFREFRRIGDTIIDNCYTHLMRDGDGLARAALRDPRTGRTVTVWMDGAFPYLVVFTGDTLPQACARQALAIEPMTCATDAFNHPEWGLTVLAPGESFVGVYGVEMSGG